MSRRPILIALAVCAAAAAADAPVPAPVPLEGPEPAAAPEAPTVRPWTGNVDGYIGFKGLDHGDWDPIDGQAAFGVLFDFRPRTWPINLCAHLLVSFGYDKDERTDVETTGSTSELQIGIKKIFGEGEGTFRAWVAGGFAIVTASRRIDPRNAGAIHDSGSGVGGWVGGGVYWTIVNAFNIGPFVEVSAAQVDLFGRNVQAGGIDAGILLGYHW